MDEALTRPERAAQIRQAKRYRSAITKRGICCACVNRDKDRKTVFGMSCCSIGQDRIHPQCETDERGLTFKFDDSVLEEFRDAA